MFTVLVSSAERGFLLVSSQLDISRLHRDRVGHKGDRYQETAGNTV